MELELLTWQPDLDLQGKKNMVLFDRDDTLIENAGQHSDKSRLIWLNNALESITKLSQLGFEIGVVSNQSAISRGIFSKDEFIEFTEEMNRQCFSAVGVNLAVVVACPHAPTDKCKCRKPAPGLLEQAARVTSCEISVLFGDKESDIQAAQNYGVLGIQVNENNLLSQIDKWLSSQC